MTFDQTVLLWCIAVPAAIAAAGCLLSKFVAAKAAVRIPHRLSASLIVSMGWWLAVAAALVGCQGWQWWPEDAWRRGIWPLLAWVLVICSTSWAEDRTSWRWVLAGVLSIATAMIAMPSGEGWEDTLPLHRHWLGLIATSCLVNSYALERLSKSGGHRWSLLVALAGLGGPMALAASTYGSLAQWTMAMIVATAVIAALAVFSDLDSGLWTAAIPATVGAAGITASGRFYTWEVHANWVYAAILFAPAVVVLIDLMIRRRGVWLRVGVSAVVSAACVAVSIWQVLLR